MERGRSPNFIAALLNLSTAEVLTLIHYIEEHKDEVMAVHRRIEERIAKGNPPEIEARMADSPTHAMIQTRLAEIQRRCDQEGSNGESDSGR